MNILGGNVIEIGIQAREDAIRTMQRTAAEAETMGTSMSRSQLMMAGAAGAIGGALITLGYDALRTAGRLAAIPAAIGESTNRLSEMGRALGIAEQDLARVKYAAEANGVAFTSAATGVYFMNRTLGDAVAGVDAAKDAFDRLGLDAQAEIAKGSAQAFLDVVGALNKLPDVQARAAAGQDVFGRGAKEMGVLLAMSRSELEKFFETADASGYTPSAKLIEMSKTLDDVNDRLAAAKEGAKNAFSETWIPALTRINELLTDILDKKLMPGDFGYDPAMAAAAARKASGRQYVDPRAGQNYGVPLGPPAPTDAQWSAMYRGRYFAPGTGPGERIEPPPMARMDPKYMDWLERSKSYEPSFPPPEMAGPTPVTWQDAERVTALREKEAEALDRSRLSIESNRQSVEYLSNSLINAARSGESLSAAFINAAANLLQQRLVSDLAKAVIPSAVTGGGGTIVPTSGSRAGGMDIGNVTLVLPEIRGGRQVDRIALGYETERALSYLARTTSRRVGT